ncbi:tetratricopeptide repeat protein [Spirulina major]|uniref:tetratricopeptide repeat protein n=1 Tax=Spirulina major TaxID=270636 RepID=UPI0009322F84|nr:tetratricopeptide repeat protein [Spirulina major]
MNAPTLYQDLAIDMDAVPLATLSDYAAVEYFLTVETPSATAPRLAQVEPYLQAFEHLATVADWPRAAQVIQIIPDPSTPEELHHQLGNWGDLERQKQIYQHLLNRVNTACDTVCLTGLGNIALTVGDFTQGQEYHQQHFAIAQTTNDRHGQWIALVGLGNIERGWGKHAAAAHYFEQALDLIQQCEPSDKTQSGLAMILGNLASVRPQDDTALPQAQRCLDLARQLGHRSLEALALVLLGDTYTEQGQPESALTAYQTGLALAEQQQEPETQAEALRGLGEVYCDLDRIPEAYPVLGSALAIAQDLDIPTLQRAILTTLGNCHYSEGDYESAFRHYHQTLKISSRIKDRIGILEGLWGLSSCCDAAGDLEQAIHWDEQRLLMARLIDHAPQIESAAAYLGYAYLNMERYPEARDILRDLYRQQRLTGVPADLIITLTNLAAVHRAVSEFPRALVYVRRALRLAQQVQSDSVPQLRQFQQQLRAEMSPPHSTPRRGQGDPISQSKSG